MLAVITAVPSRTAEVERIMTEFMSKGIRVIVNYDIDKLGCYGNSVRSVWTAIAEAHEGEPVIMAEDDIIFSEGWYEKLTRFTSEHPEEDYIKLFTPPYRGKDKAQFLAFYGADWAKVNNAHTGALFMYFKDIRKLWGAFLLWKTNNKLPHWAIGHLDLELGVYRERQMLGIVMPFPSIITHAKLVSARDGKVRNYGHMRQSADELRTKQEGTP